MKHLVFERVMDFTKDRNALTVCTSITEIAIMAAQHEQLHDYHRRGVVSVLSFVGGLVHDLSETPQRCIGSQLEIMFHDLDEHIQRLKILNELESCGLDEQIDMFESSIENFKPLFMRK